MDEEQDQQGALQDRIARFMQSDQTCKRQVTDEERKLFQKAVGRLDKMLSVSAEMDMQILRAGAERLELLLREISSGKNVATGLKQTKKTVEADKTSTVKSSVIMPERGTANPRRFTTGND